MDASLVDVHIMASKKGAVNPLLFFLMPEAGVEELMVGDDPYIKHGECEPRQNFHKEGATEFSVPSRGSKIKLCFKTHTIFCLFGIASY
jgi:hypothetical protein